MEKTKERPDDSQLPYAHWLYNIPGVGNKTIKHLLSCVQMPETLYHLSAEQIERALFNVRKKNELAERIDRSRQNRDVHTAYRQLEEKGIHFTCLGHTGYPDKLSQIPDAPYGIYFRGNLPEQTKPAAAIIGARSCSEYGRRMAAQFGKELAKAGIQIISGMARGIDGIGQKAALEAGGYSLGVMGCGVDICYPAENRDLYDMLCRQGGICSEYPPGTTPKNSLFPPRNRLISGLSDFILVIEAKSRSGTLITVDMALEQGKEVYALPGRVTDALSEGCNRLLQQGAGVMLSPGDMIQNFTGKPYTEQEAAQSLLSDVQTDILQCLAETPQSVEQIQEQLLSKNRSDIELTDLMNQLIMLSLNGFATQIGGCYFTKAVP